MATATKPAQELFRAAKKGDLASVQRLVIDDPALLGACDDEGHTALHFAAWKGCAEVVAFLLQQGAGTEAHSTNGHYGGTPLHAAAHGNQAAVVKLLLEHGADVHAISANGRTPLEETPFHNATAAAKLLRAAGA
ncbi:MAG: ankyrin repeat domain-containing protein [Armatimonadetes bacterium]|nr:ankyrin repeat domain-containing protein [Armatimonadota bacterium]